MRVLWSRRCGEHAIRRRNLPAITRTLVLCFAACSASCDRGASPGPSKERTIAVIPKATTYEFWKSVRAGAEREGRELGVKVLWKGPVTEGDREAQINLLEDFITIRVDAICIAPVDSRSLVGPIRSAAQAGIPTVVFDSGLDDLSSAVSFVATDNRLGGAIAARHLGAELGGMGGVIVLRYTPGSQSSADREDGFLEALRKELPQVTVLSDGEYAGASPESALDKAQQLLSRLGDKVAGVFTPCQHVSSGMLRALEERGLAGKVKFVGFDASPELVQALRAGKMHGIVLQDPVAMGRIAVRTAVEHLDGRPAPPRVSTGEHLATRSNLDDPAIKKLLEPEVWE